MVKRTVGKVAGTGNGTVLALLYPRVSSAEQEKEGLSLPAQQADLRRYAGAMGWVIGAEYPEVLRGTNDDRPQYQAMLAEVRRLRAEGRPVVIVVKWLHRLGRKLAESVRAREELKALGVPVHSVLEGGEVSDFLANIMASVAQYEVEQLGERVSESRDFARENGWHAPGRVAWGFTLRDATPEERQQGAPQRVWIEDAARSGYPREAFRRVADGESIRAVSAWIATLSDEIRGGRRMAVAVIADMLRAPVYVGEYVDAEGTVHPGRWPALVDRATFDRVQERLASHKKVAHQGTKYLLSGLLRCPVEGCGERMGGKAQYQRASKRYICTNRVYNRPGVVPHDYQVVMEPVDAYVLEEVVRPLERIDQASVEAQRQGRAAWGAIREPKLTGDDAARMRQLRAQERQAASRLKTLAFKLADGIISDESYQLSVRPVERDLAAVREQLTALRAKTPALPELPDYDTLLALCASVRAALRTASIPLLREGLARFITKVVPHREGRGQYRVEIAWTPLGEAIQRLAAALALPSDA